MDKDFEENSSKLIQYYTKMDYPRKTLTKHCQKAVKFKQDELLDKIPVQPTKSTPVMVTNYNPSNPNIRRLINNNWNIIPNSLDCSTLYHREANNRVQKTFKHQGPNYESLTYPGTYLIKNDPSPVICNNRSTTVV